MRAATLRSIPNDALPAFAVGTISAEQIGNSPDLARGDLTTTWIYVAGPTLGALIGVVFEWILKDKPTAAGARAAQGALDTDDSA